MAFNPEKCIYFKTSEETTFNLASSDKKQIPFGYYYSGDDGMTWSEITTGVDYSIPANTKVYLKGDHFSSYIKYEELEEGSWVYKIAVTTFIFDEFVEFGGNISALLDNGEGSTYYMKDWPEDKLAPAEGYYGFNALFSESAITSAPIINISNLEAIQMAPVLTRMFYNCANLKKVVFSSNSWGPIEGTTFGWLEGVPADGEFLCSVKLQDLRGESYIPEFWQIERLPNKIKHSKTFYHKNVVARF